MASSSSRFIPLLLLALLPLFSSSTVLRQREGRKVGGRTDVPDVAGNEEIQALGRFAVAEYNRRMVGDLEDGMAVRFRRVVEAQRQVVSGIKYYLRIAAAGGGEGEVEERWFDAVVVVKPWVDSKELLSFGPSSSSK